MELSFKEITDFQGLGIVVRSRCRGHNRKVLLRALRAPRGELPAVLRHQRAEARPGVRELGAQARPLELNGEARYRELQAQVGCSTEIAQTYGVWR